MNRKLPEVNWLIKGHLRLAQRDPREPGRRGRSREPSGRRWSGLGGCPLVCSERSAVRGLGAGTGAGRGRGEGPRGPTTRFLGCGLQIPQSLPRSSFRKISRVCFPCPGGVYNLLKGTFRLSK